MSVKIQQGGFAYYMGGLMNITVDYCGILCLLRQLIDAGAVTCSEAKRIAARIARQIGADPLIFL